MADPAETGKYGTVRLLKRREPTTVVASYPIDDEEVTFGRDSSCSVRLYYQWVSSIHCKLIFEERKAFLQILGANGVIVDGCPVFPAKTSGAGPTTVPLPNGSTFEIYKKLFIFNYPPKELRPQLFTPISDSKRCKTLRMSMVQSAQVFSPAPSPNPLDNLRILQSPLKLSSMAEEEPITLVDGNNPLVFQEEQDLVILEDVDPSNKSASPPPLPILPQLPPQTPRRKSIPSLHRAVLIRSAQRVQQMREFQAHRQRPVIPMQTQAEVIHIDEDDAAEEEEVEEAISDDLIIFENSDEEDVMDEDAEGEENFEAKGTEVEMDDEQDITEARDEYEEEVFQPQQSTPAQSRPAPQLGKFMTPQPSHFSQHAVKEGGKDMRQKVGPQRPPPGYRFSLGPGLGNGILSMQASEENSKETNYVESQSRSTSPSKPRPEVSDEERKAIIERRKSALKAPDADFAEHVPGLRAGRTSLAPKTTSTPASPFKNIRATIDDGEDTRNVLQRLEESLEDMRKKSASRQSIGISRGSEILTSPEKSGFSLLAKSVGVPFDKTKVIKRDLRMPSYGRDMSALTKGTSSQLMKDESDEREGDMDVGNMDVDDANNGKVEEAEGGNAAPSSPSKEAKAARRARRSEIVPATPRMDGLKEMFQAPRSDAGLATPAVRGMRNLFREKPAGVPSTPRMDGMRTLFTERHVPATPAYDGINEMMPEKIVEEDEEQDEEQIDEGSGETVQRIQEDEVMQDESGPQPESQHAVAPRTTARSKAKLVRGTPTDLSTMADDEMTPDVGAGPVTKQHARKTEDNGAVVHKTSRARKTVAKRSAEPTEDEPAGPKTKKPSGRQRKSTEDSPEAESNPAPKAKPKSRARKPESSATGTDIGADSLAKPTRRTRTASASNTATSEDEKPAARTTRARSRSVEPESETGVPESIMHDDPLANASARHKRSARAKVQAVETIPEEEEAAAPGPVKPLRKTTATRSCKAQTQSDVDGATTSHSEANAAAAPKKKPASRSRAVKELAPVDAEAARKEERADKENTPERSPASSNESNEEHLPAKANGRAKATAKTTASKVPTSKATRASKSVKVSTDEDAAAVAPKATRTRARK